MNRNTVIHHVLLLQMRFLVLYSSCISLLFASIDAREFSGSRLFHRTRYSIEKTEISPSPEISSGSGNYHYKPPHKRWEFCTMLVLLFSLMLFIAVIFMRIKSQGNEKDKKALTSLAQPPIIHSLDRIDLSSEKKTTTNNDTRSELAFFVDEGERFELNELMESAADLRTQGFCSSLYVVQIKNGDSVFAVKRLKKLSVSLEDFGRTMRWVGNLKHPNLLPLVCFNSTREEKLLVYPYQKNGSLLNLFENYINGKRMFPWRLRLSIAHGIARGLDFIHSLRDQNDETVPHGNIKLSNIMLSDKQGGDEEEAEKPLISEYGYSQFIDRSSAHYLFGWNGHHVAPERSLSKHGDVYGFGVILLQMLTGKVAGKSGFDVVRWVRSMVREEWTGEVFDKKMGGIGMCGFALLNVGLKCVSDEIEDRPSISEVVERIEEVVRAREDASV